MSYAFRTTYKKKTLLESCLYYTVIVADSTRSCPMALPVLAQLEEWTRCIRGAFQTDFTERENITGKTLLVRELFGWRGIKNGQK